MQFLPGANSSQRTECAARLLSGVSLVRCQGEEPFFNGARPVGRGSCLENSSAFKRRPGFESLALRHFCPHGAIAARLVLNQEAPERYRVRTPFSPDSSKAERPAYIRRTGEHYLVGRPFLHSSVAQKQSTRLITGRPRRDTVRRDHTAV